MTEQIKEKPEVVEAVTEVAIKPKATKKTVGIPVVVKKGFWIDEKTKIKKGAEDVSISRKIYDQLIITGAVERNDPLPE